MQVEIWEVYMNALLREEISDFERGKRVPLPVLLQYARIVGVYMDAIVDNDLDFPGTLQSPQKHGAIKRTPTKTTRKR